MEEVDKRGGHIGARGHRWQAAGNRARWPQRDRRLRCRGRQAGVVSELHRGPAAGAGATGLLGENGCMTWRERQRQGGRLGNHSLRCILGQACA